MATSPRRSSGKAKKATTPKRGAPAGSDPSPTAPKAKPTEPVKAPAKAPIRKRAAPKGGAAASTKQTQAGKAAIRGAHNPEKPGSTPGLATKKRAVVAQSGERRPVTPKAAGSKPADRATAAPPQPIEDGAPDPATGLTPRVRAFADEYLRDLNGTKAYLRIHPDAKVTTAATESCRLLRNPKVREYIAAQRAKLEVEIDFTRVDLVRELVMLVRADPGEISQMRVVSCQACWPLEDAADLPYWQEPNPDCPRCQGDGYPKAYFADTRKLGPRARKLFQAVHVTKEGMKVVLRDQDAALEKLAKILGAYEADNSQKAGTVAEALREFFSGLHSGAGRLPIAKPEPGAVSVGAGTGNPLVSG